MLTYSGIVCGLNIAEDNNLDGIKESKTNIDKYTSHISYNMVLKKSLHKIFLIGDAVNIDRNDYEWTVGTDNSSYINGL